MARAVRLAVIGAVLWTGAVARATGAVPGVSGATDEGSGVPTVGAEGGPSRRLSPYEERRWSNGRGLFQDDQTPRTGLGDPGFNATSCAACHALPAVGGAGGPDADVLVPHGQNHYEGRPARQNGSLVLRADEGPRGNRQTPLHELRARLLERGEEARVVASFEVLQTPSLLGLGAIGTIPESEILRNEDPDDRDGDGVRGEARRVEVNGANEIGRFGWRAEVPRLSDFVCRALGGELGLTAPDQGRGFGLREDADDVLDPEMLQEDLDDLAFFVELLAPPQPAADTDAWTRAEGARLFERVGCASCHVPALQGSEGPVALYSDLLLHRIQEPPEGQRGPALRRQRPRDDAPRPETRFRTAPLWGIGHTAPYLHDGSAATLDAAVRAHALEAERARRGYERLTQGERDLLLAFLGGL